MVSTFGEVRGDEADGTDNSVEPDINDRGGSRIATRDKRTGDQRLPASNTPTLTPRPDGGDPSECSRLSLSEFVFVTHHDSAARTRTHAWGLYRNAERATLLQHS